MNIRIIDPGKSASSRPAARGSGEVCDDLDDEPEPEPATSAAMDDRFDLLIDLKYLARAYFRRALSPERPLSPVVARHLGGHAGALDAAIAALRKTGEDLGLGLAAPPRVDLECGFAALAMAAGVADLDPFASESDLLTGGLLVNALGLAVIAGFLGECDAAAWRPVLLPMLEEDARFDGWLEGMLESRGEEVTERTADLRALASGPASRGVAGELLWSFDLLRMAVSRLACGGSRERRGGFFPDGMSGTAG
jgi:hypothetical protein